MNNFRKVYREAGKRLHVPKITAMSVMDEERRRRQKSVWRRRRFAAAAGTACILAVCMAGTATAVNYTRSIIRVTDSGFSIVDDVTAQRSGGAGEGSEEEYGGVIIPEQNSEEIARQSDVGVLGEGEEFALCDAEECEEESAEYTSLEQLWEGEEDLMLPVPDLDLLGEEITCQQYIVMNMWTMVRIQAGEKMFMMSQTDYRNTQGHASAVTYGEDVCNERKYSTRQGYTYTVIDSVQEEGKLPEIHAAISVNEFELIVDFTGYTQDEAYQILENMDLSVYF